MGNRAHNRRHEGRAIRKARRERRERMAKVAAGFAAFGRVAEQAVASFAEFAEGVQRFRAGIARFGGPLEPLAPPAHNHPSEGVNAAQRVSGPLVTMPDVDAAAADLGIQLLPWQRQVAEAWLRRETVAVTAGKRAGKSTLERVMHHAHSRAGHEIAGAWADEAADTDREVGSPGPL